MSAQPRRQLTRGPCGKAIYLTRAEAQRVVDGYRRRKPKERASVYRCAVCRAWHWGHLRNQISREDARRED